MYINTMPDALKWRAIDPFLRVHRDYAELLSERMADLIEKFRTVNDRATSELIDLSESVPQPVLARVVTAPEMSTRFLWKANDETTLEFMIEMLKRESYKETKLGPAIPGWGVLGNYRVNEEGEIVVPAFVGELPPIDIESPFTLNTDLGNDEAANSLTRERLKGKELNRLEGKLSKAWNVIKSTSDVVALMINLFTKVLVLQKHPTETTFSSGTTGQYIGRVVLVDAQANDVAISDIADGLVHESIHGVLFMQERRKTWIFDDALYDSTPRVISPWSGRHLPLRAFLQACFVWYGLLNFWLRVQTQNVKCHSESDWEDQVRSKMGVAASGFLSGSLTEQLARFAPDISEDVLKAIEIMQGRVVDALTLSS